MLPLLLHLALHPPHLVTVTLAVVVTVGLILGAISFAVRRARFLLLECDAFRWALHRLRTPLPPRPPMPHTPAGKPLVRKRRRS